jgi:hypothetical protein
LTVGDGLGANLKSFIFAVTRDPNGLLWDDGGREPAFREVLGEDNSSSNARGWAQATEGDRTALTPTFATIAALVGARSNRAKTVEVANFAAAGDNGGGTFRWNATSTALHDGGVVIQPGFGTAAALTTGRWERQYSGAISTAWFGAGRGIDAADTAGIQAAINLAATLTSTKSLEIRIPFPVAGSGFYGINQTLTIQGHPNQTIRLIGETASGAGNMGVRLRWTGATDGTLLDCPGVNGLRIQNLWLDGAGVAKRVLWIRPDQVNAIGASGVDIHDCQITSPRNVAGGAAVALGPNTGGITQTDNIRFYGCTIQTTYLVGQLADGIVNLAGNNTKNVALFGSALNYFRYGLNMALSSGPTSMFGGVINGCVGAAVLAGGNARLALYDVEAEGNNAIVNSGGGVGSGAGSILMKNCEWYMSPVNASAYTGDWDVAIDFLGGAVDIEGGLIWNQRNFAITAATNTAPIVCTAAAHLLKTGDRIEVFGALGNTSANGFWTVTVSDANTFTLVGSVGNGTYSGSGFVYVEAKTQIGSQELPTNSAFRATGCQFWISQDHPSVYDTQGNDLFGSVYAQAHDVRVALKSCIGASIASSGNSTAMPDIDMRAQRLGRYGAGSLITDTTGQLVVSGPVDVLSFGAISDVAGAADGVLSGGSVNNLQSTATTFTAADVGKIVLIHTPKTVGTGTVTTSTSFVANEGYLLTGSGTLFTTEFFTGQRIKIASAEYNVVSVASNTSAYIYPAPPSLSGQTFYRSVQHAATISALVNSHNVTISPGATVAGSSLRFCYGTDNLASFNDAIAFAQARGKEVLIPGSARAYALSGPLDQITIPGLKISGHGAATLAQSVFGSDDWLRTDLQYGSTVRVFSGGFLEVDGQPYVGPTLAHFAVVGPGYGTGTGLGRNTGLAHDWVNCKLTDVIFANFKIGIDFDTTFACTQDDLAVVGCGRGLHYIGSNTHKSIGLSAQACGVGLDLEGLGESSFTGALFQANIGQASTFFRPADNNNACNQLKFQTCHWENNADSLHLGNFIRMHAANNTTIAAIEFDMCHSGDLYTFEPTQAGTGTIVHITTIGSQFAGTVKPRWSVWTNGGSWSLVDLSNMTDTTMQLLSKGGSATPDGTFGNYYLCPINTGPTPDEISPDLLNGFEQHVIYSSSLKVNQPKFNGVNPPLWWTLTLYFRPQAGGTEITWNGNFITNPWTDAGSVSGKSSFITWIHIGSGVWVVKEYQQFDGSQVPPELQVQIISGDTSAGYGTTHDIRLTASITELALSPDGEGHIVTFYNDVPVKPGAIVKIFNFSGLFDLTIKNAGAVTLCHVPGAPTFGPGYAEIVYTINATLGGGAANWVLMNPGNCST